MKKLIIPILTVLLAAGACKKKSDPPLPTTMTMVVNNDTLWTSTNVDTDNKDMGTVYIKGTSTDGNESLDLALSGFTNRKGTFVVDYRGTGGNINGNTGMYRKGSEAIMARAGRIVVTEVTETLINGTYDLYYLQTNFKGSFVASLR
jgi:hypothetical protein